MKLQTSPHAQRTKAAPAFNAYAVKAAALAERATGYLDTGRFQSLTEAAALYLLNAATIYANRKGGPTEASNAACDLSKALYEATERGDVDAMLDLAQDVTGTCLHLIDGFYGKEVR